jgi:hypothetical protein
VGSEHPHPRNEISSPVTLVLVLLVLLVLPLL